MDKDKLTNNENSEIINKLYSDNKLSQKYNSNNEYDKRPKVKEDGESQKYIKEMYEFADKNEFKGNVVFLAIGVVIVLVITLSILLNAPFMKPKTDIAANKIVTKTNVDNSSTKATETKPIASQTKIFEYLNIEGNRTLVLSKAVSLNKGSEKGVTIYLLSETLRLNGFDIPASTSSVEGLMKSLTSLNWKKNSDFTQLEKGDICFTIDVPKKPGVPSHAYVFMGWVEAGKTDYANVCDGQVEAFGGILHKRNLSISTTQKDKFSFFLRK